MVDTRDSGPLILTHLYLLLGFSLPLWLFPHRSYTGGVCVCVCGCVWTLSPPPPASKLALYSGVLALGVGDSMAAMAGKLMGKTKWPGERVRGCGGVRG